MRSKAVVLMLFLAADASLFLQCSTYELAISVLCLFLVVSWVGLQSVILAFSEHPLPTLLGAHI